MSVVHWHFAARKVGVFSAAHPPISSVLGKEMCGLVEKYTSAAKHQLFGVVGIHFKNPISWHKSFSDRQKLVMILAKSEQKNEKHRLLMLCLPPTRVGALLN